MAPSKCTTCNAVFKSKGECNQHRGAAGHTAPAEFICFACPETFAKLKALKAHRSATGHSGTIPAEFAVAGPARTQPPKYTPPPTEPRCKECFEPFATFHELAGHRRTAHGKAPSIQMRCERCNEVILWGEVHAPSCPASASASAKRAACAVCRQKFSSSAELAAHCLANPLSCEICAVHLPPGMCLQDHWRVSNQHPYCKMCDSAFRDSREWVGHTWTCSLARGNLTPAANDDRKQAIVEEVDPGERILFLDPSPELAEVAVKTDWFLSGLPERSSSLVPSGGSSRRSSLSSLGKTADDAHLPADDAIAVPGPDPDVLGGDVSDTELVEILAREYGQHSIERILSVLDDDEDGPSEEPRSTRSLLSPPRTAAQVPALSSGMAPSSAGESGYACETSLAAHCSSVWDTSSKEYPAEESPPMLGCRRETRKPALEIDAAYAPPESTSDRVASWLEELLQLARASKPPLPPAGPGAVPTSETHATGRGAGVSWHCRSCLRQPCVDPVATSCGHVFCQSCIMKELKASASCPVCQMEYFVRLKPYEGTLVQPSNSLAA